MTVWVALLRAVNVGGRTLPMRTVAAVAERAGATDVRTYLQSGNVVFAGTRTVAAGLSAALSAEAGFDVPVLLRTGAELAAVVAGQPHDGPEQAWHVTFLSSAPKAAAVSALQDAVAGGGYGADTFAVAGREVYLRVPDGYGRSKLSNALFERRLGVVATTRNWRTVNALAELAAGTG